MNNIYDYCNPCFWLVANTLSLVLELETPTQFFRWVLKNTTFSRFFWILRTDTVDGQSDELGSLRVQYVQYKTSWTNQVGELESLKTYMFPSPRVVPARLINHSTNEARFLRVRTILMPPARSCKKFDLAQGVSKPWKREELIALAAHRISHGRLGSHDSNLFWWYLHLTTYPTTQRQYFQHNSDLAETETHATTRSTWPSWATFPEFNATKGYSSVATKTNGLSKRLLYLLLHKEPILSHGEIVKEVVVETGAGNHNNNIFVHEHYFKRGIAS